MEKKEEKEKKQNRSKFRHTVVAGALKPNLLPTINSRHSSEDMDMDKPEGPKDKAEKSSSTNQPTITNNKSSSFDSRIKDKDVRASNSFSKDSKPKKEEKKI